MIDWSKINTKELAIELAKRPDLFDQNGFLSTKELYDLRCKLGAVICVDSAPVRKRADGSIEVMAIRRKTGPYAGKFCLVGGIVKKNSSLEESVRSHLKTDLGVEIESLTSWNQPVCAYQYMHPLPDGSLKNDFIIDPTKDHSIGLVYLIRLKNEVFEFGATSYGGQEVGEIIWFSFENMPSPNEFGYNHDIVFRKCLSLAKILLK